MLALSREGTAGKYPVSTDGNIKALTQDTSLKSNVRMVDVIANGGQYVTAQSQEMFDHYKETFGFEEVDGLDMKLSDNAVNIYTDKKGKITATSVRDNLGGFANENFSPAVRFSKEARKNLDQIANMSQADIIARDEELLATGNDGSSVLGKIFEWTDQMILNMNRFTDQLEQEFLEKFGGRKTRGVVRVLGFASGKKLNTYDTELLQKAMNLYIASGSGKNLDKVMAYAKKLGARGMKNLKGRELDQLEQIERMVSLTEEEKAWADSTIRPYYEDLFTFAQEKGIIDSHVDNYVKRVWKMPKSLEGTVTWSGAGTTGFKLKSPSGEQRVFDSIIDGWEAGMDLKVQSVLQNLSNYGTEVGQTFTNRKFIEYMRGLISFNQGGLMHEVNTKQDPDFKPPKHYSQVLTHGFAKPFHKLYARNDIAGILNNLTSDAGSQHWTAQLVRRLNSTIKSVILNVSLFHHLAGLRSYTFGVGGKHWGQWNPVKAYKRGLKLIDDQVGLDGQYRTIGPIVDFLVREGLTIGKTQDWEDMGGVGWVEEALLKMSGPKWQGALSGWRKAGRFRRGMTTGLFNRLFAGLKAEAGSIEFVHKINKLEKKLGRPLNDAELKTTAQQVAALINADFGGLHHGRLNRSQKLQRSLQLFLLAPDWTESNWRTVIEAIPGAKKVPDIIRKTFTDAPAPAKNLMPEGMSSVYRKFWWGITKRGVLSVALLQGAIMALLADDDEREDYWDHFKQQFTSLSQFSKGKWTEVDFTPIARRLGVGDPDKRQTFSLIGHFKDVIKILSPSALIKHKLSAAVRVGETILLKTDWKGDEFSSFAEFLETGSMTKEQFNSQPSTFWEQAPVIAMYNVRSSFPIFMSEGLRSLAGETTYLTGVSKALGMDVKDNRAVSAGQRKYEEMNSEINDLAKNLKDAQTVGDRRMITEARKDIKRYDKHDRKKSQIGYTKLQLRPINKEIKDLMLIDETKGLTDRQQRKLDKAKAKRDKVYAKFLKVVKRY